MFTQWGCGMLECGVVENKGVETVSRPSRSATDPTVPTTKTMSTPTLHKQDFSSLDSGVLRSFSCFGHRFFWCIQGRANTFRSSDSGGAISKPELKSTSNFCKFLGTIQALLKIPNAGAKLRATNLRHVLEEAHRV